MNSSDLIWQLLFNKNILNFATLQGSMFLKNIPKHFLFNKQNKNQFLFLLFKTTIKSKKVQFKGK